MEYSNGQIVQPDRQHQKTMHHKSGNTRRVSSKAEYDAAYADGFREKVGDAYKVVDAPKPTSVPVTEALTEESADAQ